MNVSASQMGSYTLEVNNNVNASRAAVLTVLSPPEILTQPQSQAVSLGNTVSLSVVASGPPPLQYQWQLNGVVIPGATNPTLAIANFQLAHAGAYNVTVANSLGAIDSEVARARWIPKGECLDSPEPQRSPLSY